MLGIGVSIISYSTQLGRIPWRLGLTLQSTLVHLFILASSRPFTILSTNRKPINHLQGDRLFRLNLAD